VAYLCGLSNLTALHLACCTRLSDDAARYIARMAGLTELDLQGCTRLTNAGVRALWSLPALESLELAGCSRYDNRELSQTSDEGLSAHSFTVFCALRTQFPPLHRH
jgi:hypothetical protein